MHPLFELEDPVRIIDRIAQPEIMVRRIGFTIVIGLGRTRAPEAQHDPKLVADGIGSAELLPRLYVTQVDAE